MLEFSSSVQDFRRTTKGNIRHKLGDILTLMILARLCGQTSRADIIEFGRFNLKRLRKMGILDNGVPSEPTFCRIEKGIDNSLMAEALRKFSDFFRSELTAKGEPDIICMDGKALCGTVQENCRNPDIVSAFSSGAGITLATEPCQEKSNEIKAMPLLIGKLDIAGHVVTADAMAMQKDIVDAVRKKDADFLIELKANQKALMYGVEDRLVSAVPLQTFTDGPELDHGRIETRTYTVYDGLDLVADRSKWGEGLTVIVFGSDTIRKSTGERTTERRLYISSLAPHAPYLGHIIRKHWSIESMHWHLDRNFLQDSIKRRHTQAARNLDTIQRIVHAVFSIWRGRRRKLADKAKGIAELKRHISFGFTRLMRFLSQK